jgi:hypothetical protein
MYPAYKYHSFIYIYILLGDMLVYLINIINNFHWLWYIHIARQMEIQPPKIKSNLSAKRSTKQEAQGPHRSPESFWLILLIKTHAKLLFFNVAPTAPGP